MMLLGITGKARSGKDTVADYLLSKFINFRRYAFADPLKEAAQHIFGLDSKQCLDEYKEEVIEFWGISPRRMYQVLGTDCCRNIFRHDIWIKRAELQFKQYQKESVAGMVISDVRFNNEAQWIQENGGTIIKLKRSTTAKIEEHISEAGIDASLIDYEIDNNHSLSSLFEDIDDLTVKFS